MLYGASILAEVPTKNRTKGLYIQKETGRNSCRIDSCSGLRISTIATINNRSRSVTQFSLDQAENLQECHDIQGWDKMDAQLNQRKLASSNFSSSGPPDWMMITCMIGIIVYSGYPAQMVVSSGNTLALLSSPVNMKLTIT